MSHITNRQSTSRPEDDYDSSSSSEDSHEDLEPRLSTTATPLPKVQLAIIFAILLCEPLTAGTIDPFIARLVNDVSATHGHYERTGYYVGLIESSFFLMQGIFMLQWGRISDKVGRRPILLGGCIGMAISVTSFGLSKSFTRLVISRGLAGMLNGNVGVAKTAMGELTDETNRARAFSFIRVIWITGATIGPFMGGNLQHPAERFPTLFGKSDFFKTYPYFLPCFAAACYAGFIFSVGMIRLNETHPDKIRPHYKTLPPDTEDGSDNVLEEDNDNTTPPPPPPPLRAVLTRPVLIAVANYALLAILGISFSSLLSLFLAVPISSGGLGLAPPTIGLALACVGFSSGCIQVLGFPALHRRWGAKRLYLVGLGGFLVSFSAFGVMRVMATNAGRVTSGVWVVLGIQLMAYIVTDMTFSCIFIFVTTSAPTPALLGTTNGLAQTIISFVRAMGPAGATALFSFSVQRNLLGGYFVFVLFFCIALVAIGCGTLLPVEETRPAVVRI